MGRLTEYFDFITNKDSDYKNFKHLTITEALKIEKYQFLLKKKVKK